MSYACAHCGGRVADDAERCPSCGSPKRVKAPEGGPKEAAPPKRPAAPAPPARPLPAASERARSRAIVGVLAAVMVAGTLGLAAAFLVLAPSDPGFDPSAPVGPPRPSEPAGAAASAAGAGFAPIRARGELRVAADPDAPPFLAQAGDGWEGFEYGVMSAIAAEIGVPVRIVPSAFEHLDENLRAGEADLIIGQLSPSSAYDGLHFSLSYLQYSLCLVVPKGSPVGGLADLRGKRVGLYDDPVARQVTALGVGASFESRTFAGYGYFEALAAGEIDAVVYDCPLARHELAKFPALRIADDALNVASYSVAATDPALVADVDRVLRKLGDQGLLARLEARWLGASGPTEGYRTVAGRVVVVRRGDTLQSIAARELGDEARWTELRELNRDLVGDAPEGIYAGLRLRLPP